MAYALSCIMDPSGLYQGLCSKNFHDGIERLGVEKFWNHWSILAEVATCLLNTPHNNKCLDTLLTSNEDLYTKNKLPANTFYCEKVDFWDWDMFPFIILLFLVTVLVLIE